MPEAPKQYHVEHDDAISDDIITNKNKKALKYIEDVTIDADEIQERVLGEILSASADVEYLQRYGLDGRTDRKSFKTMVPVVCYEDLKVDINRIANGDTSPILCSKPISEFLTRLVHLTAYLKYNLLTQLLCATKLRTTDSISDNPTPTLTIIFKIFIQQIYII